MTENTSFDFETMTDEERALFVKLAKSETFRSILPAETLETVRKGIALDRIGKKFRDGHATAKNVDAFVVATSKVAGMIADHVEPSKTSGDMRIALETEFGTITMVLSSK